MKRKLCDLFDYFLFQFQGIRVSQRLFVLGVIAVIPWLVIFFWPDNLLHIYFFNVGQGDSIFIKTPYNYQILIDGGPSDAVLSELGKVMPFYDRNIDLVFLSHPHADHATGLIGVLKRFSVGQVLVNDIVYETDEYQTFLSLVRDKGVSKQSFLQGDKIRLSDGIKLTSFWPKAQTSIFEILDINKVSQVLRLDFSQFSALFTGDAELGVENPELVNFEWGNIDILKVPHQGSKGAVTKDILEKLKPKLAVISVGQNKFGHPGEEVIQLLRNQNIKVVRTDKEGTIEVVSDGEGWKIVNF